MDYILALFVVPMLVLYVWWARREMRFAMLMSLLAGASRRGYPLSEALRTFASQFGGKFSRQLREVAQAVASGRTLSDALTDRSSIMPEEALGLIRAGEASGTLDNAFAVLASRGCRAHSRRMKVLGLTLYPLVLLAGLALPWTLLTNLVGPRMQEIFKSFGTRLPLMYTWAPYFWKFGIISALFFITYLLLAGLPSGVLPRRGRYWGILDGIKWWLPGPRQFERHEGIRLFAQSLAASLSGGVPMREAVRMASEIHVHRGVGRRLERLYEYIQFGLPLSEAAERCGLFPARFVHILALAERGGNLVGALDEIVERCDEACDSVVAWTSAIVIPGVVLSAGLSVLVVCVGYFICLVALISHVEVVG